MNSDKTSLTKADLKKIFDTYYEALVSYAGRFLPLKDECEDLVQDIFVDLWEKNLQFPNSIALKVYLYKVARNKCFNSIKHNLVKDKYAAYNIESLEDDDLFLEQILEEEIVRQLHKAIDVLPDRKKEIIKLSLKGFKNIEIAEMLGIQLQTVKTLKSQSLVILRNKFKDLGTVLYFLLA